MIKKYKFYRAIMWLTPHGIILHHMINNRINHVIKCIQNKVELINETYVVFNCVTGIFDAKNNQRYIIILFEKLFIQ